MMSLFQKYILIISLTLLRAFLYVIFLRRLGKHKSGIKNPFALSRQFITDTEKFSVVYVASDIINFLIERAFIIGLKNALIIRSVTIILSITTAGFFGRFRTRIRTGILKKKIKNKWLKFYLADTIPSFIFRSPIYVGKLILFATFDFISWDKVGMGIVFSLISIFFFGRLACWTADMFEKYVIKKK